MKLEEFDYFLPPSLIAQYPTPERGESRLLVLKRRDERIEHRLFRDILNYLSPGDLLVMNNTRVIPARMVGRKKSGGRVELLLIPSHNGTHRGEWEVLVKNLGRAKENEKVEIQFGEDLYGEIKVLKGGRGKISFSTKDSLFDILQKYGHVPLPPYIKRKDEPVDRDRYQTVYAEKEGSIAAPTAGLHFTPTLLQSLKEKGIRITFLTLHIGPGTFTPVKVNNIEEHSMESEWVEIPEEAAQIINETKEKGGRVIAVGTTTTRSLESFCDEKGRVRPAQGWTSLFIYPPYSFRVMDGLITNFHLPKSTLIMLVSAFAGKELILKAYQEAIERKYRFYSYGDAMLIL
jgi:S-adenosylmethionine:tRNA ribosyltransferase-isomerase